MTSRLGGHPSRGNDSLLNAMPFPSKEGEGGGTPIIVRAPFCNVRDELGWWATTRSYCKLVSAK